MDYAGYKNIAVNVPLFNDLNEMPLPFNPRRLDDGVGIEATLIKMKAKYHNSCRLLFNNSKLERARKRQSAAKKVIDKDGDGQTKRQRISEPPKVECFLCEKEDEISNLRQAMTMQLNQRINQCAKKLNNGKLLAKLSAGDVVAQELKYRPQCLVNLYNAERAQLNTMLHNENSSSLKKMYILQLSQSS